MSAENARSTQGVKIHTSASAKRDDKSAIRTKMQPSGVPSSPGGADERRPSHTRKAATRTAAPSDAREHEIEPCPCDWAPELGTQYRVVRADQARVQAMFGPRLQAATRTPRAADPHGWRGCGQWSVPGSNR
jgi:hypothetical protein